MLALGLDIGTAYARAAVFRTHEAELVQFPDGAHNIPAVVSFAGGGTKVGRAALGRAATQPHLTVRAVKRMLGRDVDDAVIERLSSRAAYPLVAQERGGFVLQLGSEQRQVEDIAALLIRHVLDVISEKYGERPTSAVLTTPFWYGRRQRAALEKAAGQAGVESLQVLTEATCTALSLLDAGAGTRRVAVVDVGAGGCTASIIELAPGRVQLVSSAGDPLGGGDDVDWALALAVYKGLEARLGAFPADACVSEMIRQTCEAAKCTLAQASSVTAVIPFLPIGPGLQNQEIVIGREHIDKILQDSVARVRDACRRALESASLSKGDLAAVYATGGTTRLPAIRAAIEAVLGPISARKLDPDGSVALGAANQAGMLAGLADGVAVIDVQTNLSIPPAGQGAAASIPPAQIHTAPPPSGSDRVQVDMSSVRVEMATLLASLRAGAVTDGGKDQTQGAARANDLVEEDASLSQAQLDDNATRLVELWTLLTVCMQTARQYRWEHPQTETQLRRCVDAIGDYLKQAPESLSFDVGSMQLSYHGKVVWKPDRPPYDRIPYELFVEGLRKVQLKPGITSGEVKDFLGVLLRDASLGFGAEDDAATALWDRRLQHIGWLAVDAFADGDDPEFMEQRDELVRQIDLRGESAEQLGLYAAARRNLAESIQLVALDEASRITVEAQLHLAESEWLDRFAFAFRAAWAVASASNATLRLTSTLERWARDQAAARSASSILQLFASLDDAAALCESPTLAASLRESLLTALFSSEQILQLIDFLAEAPEEASLPLLGRALELIGGDDSLVTDVLGKYPSSPVGLQDVLVSWVTTRLEGREPLLAELLPSFSVEHACVTLAALRGLGTPAAVAAVSAALHSPHVAVRMEALASLPEAPVDRVRDDIRSLVEDPDPEMRIRVLETVASRRILAAGPTLVRRIQADSFHELSTVERRLLLDAVGALNRGRAEGIALDLLGKRGILRSDAEEMSRVLAAEFLAGSESPEALDALHRIAKSKWFTSNSVRDAAARAAGQVEQRRSVMPPKPKEVS